MQIAQVEREEENMVSAGGQELIAIQALASRNYFNNIHINASPDNKNLRLGYVYPLNNF